MSVLNINERSIFLFHNKRCQVLNVYLADNEIRYRQFLDNSELLAAQSILINIPSFQKCVQDGDIKLEDNRKHTVDTHLSAQDFNKIEYRFRYVDECFRQRPRPQQMKTQLKKLSEMLHIIKTT
jgi:virulence-associated protein VapD